MVDYAFLSSDFFGSIITKEKPMQNEKKSPHVSIVMPALNCENYITEAIGAAKRQTYTDWELIIVDNGSSDGTYSVALAESAADSRIRVYQMTDCHSAAAARRHAIDRAAGEWIAFLDSDDLWLPEKLSLQLDAAIAHSSDFVFSASSFINANGDVIGDILHVPPTVSYSEILKQNIISCSSVLIKRDLLDGCFTETDNEICEDYAAWIRILRDRNVTATGIDQPLLIYRVGASSLSSNKLRAAKRTFKTYIKAGIGIPTAVKSWLCYVVRSVNKYRKINK